MKRTLTGLFTICFICHTHSGAGKTITLKAIGLDGSSQAEIQIAESSVNARDIRETIAKRLQTPIWMMKLLYKNEIVTETFILKKPVEEIEITVVKENHWLLAENDEEIVREGFWTRETVGSFRVVSSMKLRISKRDEGVLAMNLDGNERVFEITTDGELSIYTDINGYLRWTPVKLELNKLLDDPRIPLVVRHKENDLILSYVRVYEEWVVFKYFSLRNAVNRRVFRLGAHFDYRFGKLWFDGTWTEINNGYERTLMDTSPPTVFEFLKFNRSE